METGESVHKGKKPRLSEPKAVGAHTNNVSLPTVTGVLPSFNQLSSNKVAPARCIIDGSNCTAFYFKRSSPSLYARSARSCIHCQKVVIIHPPEGGPVNIYPCNRIGPPWIVPRNLITRLSGWVYSLQIGISPSSEWIATV